MHVAHLLSQWLSNHTVIGHRAREAALLKLVHALLAGSKLSLTQLGRHRAGSAYEKHHIKAAVDERRKAQKSERARIAA